MTPKERQDRMAELVRLMSANLSTVAKNNSKKAKLMLQVAALDTANVSEMTDYSAYAEEFAIHVAAMAAK